MEKPTDLAEENLMRVCIIGGSAGSLEVLMDFLPDVIEPAGALVIVLHRRGSDDMILEDLFASRLQFPVCEVDDKTPLEKGKAYIAPPDYHLLFEKDYTLSLDMSEKVNYSRPSIDVAMTSAADAYGDKVDALLLSGANTDGTEGLIAVRKAGGFTAIQDPATAIVALMPEHAKIHASPTKVLNVNEMSDLVSGTLKKGT